MIISLTVQNRNPKKTPVKLLPLLRTALRQTLWLSGLNRQSKVEVSLILTENQEIRLLNRDYRSLDKPTDVLSFPQEEDFTLWEQGLNPMPLALGDIIISLEKAAEQAREYGHSIERELVFLFIHGLLHLLGYDHQNPEDEAQMRAMQRDILTAIKPGC